MTATITSEEMRLKNRPTWNRKDEDGCPLWTAILAMVEGVFPLSSPQSLIVTIEYLVRVS
jgi:hypothetical protein